MQRGVFSVSISWIETYIHMYKILEIDINLLIEKFELMSLINIKICVYLQNEIKRI